MKKLFLSFLVSTFSLAANYEAAFPLLPLKGEFQGLEYVCKTSLRPLALVIRKTHACDNSSGTKQCMELTQAASDLCNESLQKSFSVFHIRKGKYQEFDKGTYTPIPDQVEVWRIWDAELKAEGREANPGVILVDTENCKIIGDVFLYDFTLRGTRLERAQSVIDSLQKALPNKGNLSPIPSVEVESFNQCTKKIPETPLSGIWNLMEAQEKNNI